MGKKKAPKEAVESETPTKEMKESDSTKTVDNKSTGLKRYEEKEDELELRKGTIVIFIVAVLVGLASLRSPRDHQLYLTHAFRTFQIWAGLYVTEDYGGFLELNARRTPLGSYLLEWKEELSTFREIDKVAELFLRDIATSTEKDAVYGDELDSMTQKAEYMFFLFEIVWKGNNDAWEIVERLFVEDNAEKTTVPWKGLVNWVYTNRQNRTLLHLSVRNNHLPSVKILCSKTKSLSNALDAEGRSPIFYVSQVDIARALIEDCGADIYHIIDHHGAAPLSYIKLRYKLARKEHEPIPTSTTPTPLPQSNHHRAPSNLLSLQKDTLKETQQLREVISYLANLGAPSPYPPEQFFY